MKLSEGQTQELYKFTRKHHVEHYDLQTELVDHLANGIEAQCEESPDLLFEEALNKEFQKFGVSGFEDVIRKRTIAMQKRYLKIVLRFYRDYFKLPRILMTVLLIFGMAVVLFAIPLEYRYDCAIFFMLAIAGGTLLHYFKNRSSHELECVRHGKKWMLKDQIYGYAQWSSLINLFPIVLNNSYFRDRISMVAGHEVLGLAALVVCLGIFTFTIIRVIPKKADKLLAESYPGYNIA